MSILEQGIKQVESVARGMAPEKKFAFVVATDETGRDFGFGVVKRVGDEVVIAAELQHALSKQRAFVMSVVWSK